MNRGAALESAAERWLAARGLEPIARNLRYRVGELDLVMREAATVVLVEVRFRRDDAFGGAVASLDPAKQRRLRAAAAVFLQRHPEYRGMPLRFDLLAGSGDPAAPRWRWIRNAIEDAP
ncbi:MAG: YraN family protein [Xanthomonadales bacterium]|nr:YraN family protein [Xanthomonadales bacterium]